MKEWLHSVLSPDHSVVFINTDHFITATTTEMRIGKGMNED